MQMAYHTSFQKAEMAPRSIELRSPAEVVALVLGHESDFRDVLSRQEAQDKALMRIGADLSKTVLISDALLVAAGMPGGYKEYFPGERADNSALAAALAIAFSNKKATPTTPTATAVDVASLSPLNFGAESNAYVASTEVFIGVDGVVAASALLAGCKGTVPRTFTRMDLSTPTNPVAAGATFQVKVYETWDGVNHTLVGSATFTGDGSRKWWDSSYNATLAPIFTALSKYGQSLAGGGINPGVTLGIVSSANLTTKVGVTLY